MKKGKFKYIAGLFLTMVTVAFHVFFAQAMGSNGLYYYLTGTEWNMGTEAYTVVPYGEGVFERDYVNKAFTANGEVISQYQNGMHIYVRPGTVLKFGGGTDWKQTDVWNVENANAKKFVHDGWEWAVVGEETEDFGKLYSVMLIGETEEYKTIEVTIGVKAGSGQTEDITMYIYVVPENTVSTLAEVLEQQHNDGVTDELDSLYIRTLPVTLYDYDGLKFNSIYGRNIQFLQVSRGVKTTNATLSHVLSHGINNGTNKIKQGIFQDRLDENGLPVPAFELANTNLFSDTSDEAKTVYTDVDFQFVFDSATNYYTYSSMLNHAQYNAEKNTVELYRQSMGTVDLNEHQTNQNWGGFYPFTDIFTAFNHSRALECASNTSLHTWAEMLREPYDRNSGREYYAQLVKDLVKTTKEYKDDDPEVSTVNMHFGMKLQTAFYLPEDKKNDGEELIFEFTGDDDMWVFIDGMLVLDMGGGHSAQSGSINFTTGEIYIQHAARLLTADSMTEAGEVRESKEALKNLEVDQMHTMTIFYLERFSGESNCYMRFNLPIVPDNEVHVSKSLTDQDGKELSVKPDTAYRFQLYVKGREAESFEALKGYAYTVNGEAGVTGADGSFYLKAGETAVFSDIARFTTVYAVEYLEDDTYVYTKVQAGNQVSTSENGVFSYENGQEGVHASQQETIQLASGIKYAFQNYMLTQQLTVSKETVGGRDGLIDGQQEFRFRLCIKDPITGDIEAVKTTAEGTKQAVTITMTKDTQTGHFVGDFSLKQGEWLSIASIPVQMSYSIEELEPSEYAGSFDAPVYKYTVKDTLVAEQTLAFGNAFEEVWKENADAKEALQIEAGGENKIVITNLQRGMLTIQKQGWEEADENQTFVFHIKGVDGTHTQGTELTVCVTENGSAVVKGLIIGAYTVTEEEDWSWRYEAAQDVYRVEKGQHWFDEKANVLVTAENDRTGKKWFDGNNRCQNIFKVPDIAAAE